RPAATLTPALQVQAVHNGKWISFRISWKDKDKSEAGPTGTYSDGVAIQFPPKPTEEPPPAFMGWKDNPVHILYWRAQYDVDKARGLRTMRDIYPNMTVDMYPLEFADMGNLRKFSDKERDVFLPAR